MAFLPVYDDDLALWKLERLLDVALQEPNSVRISKVCMGSNSVTDDVRLQCDRFYFIGINF